MIGDESSIGAQNTDATPVLTAKYHIWCREEKTHRLCNSSLSLEYFLLGSVTDWEPNFDLPPELDIINHPVQLINVCSSAGALWCLFWPYHLKLTIIPFVRPRTKEGVIVSYSCYLMTHMYLGSKTMSQINATSCSGSCGNQIMYIGECWRSEDGISSGPMSPHICAHTERKTNKGGRLESSGTWQKQW